MGVLDDYNYNVKTSTPKPSAYDSSLTNLLGERKSIEDNMSVLVGGPNMSLIRDLNQLKAKKLTQYKSNRADAENMYGTLSSELEQDFADINTGYETAITSGDTRAKDAQTRMSTELATQESRRAAAAAELGVGAENVLTDYASTKALNESMGNVASANQEWTSLLGAQKQGAAERGAKLKTSLGNTLNQTVLGMREQYNNAVDQYNAAIRAEKSKTATRKLTELGRIRMKMNTAALTELWGPEKANKYTTELTGKLQSFDDLGSKFNKTFGTPANYPGGPTAWLDAMTSKAQQVVSDEALMKSGKAPADVLLFIKQFGLSPVLPVNYSSLYGNATQ